MKSKPYRRTRATYFATRPLFFRVGENHSEKITLSQYCRKRSISKKQARKFINKKWLVITSFRNQIWVEEACPEAIADFLETPW